MKEAKLRGPRPPHEYRYRGSTIEIQGKDPKKEDVRSSLRIDGQEVAYEQTDEGVLSHDMTYVRFGSPEELAEELVRQWGEASIERGKPHTHESEPHKRSGGR